MLPKLDIREKNFHGILIIGGIAGIIEGSLRYGFTVHTLFPGMLLTLVSAFLGGFSGFILKDLGRVIRKMAPYRGVNNDGWVMGGFIGTFFGTLFQLVESANGANLVLGSMAGAYFGALLGALPDEFITPILRLMYTKHPLHETKPERSQKSWQ